jgi:hypothetical protein
MTVREKTLKYVLILTVHGDYQPDPVSQRIEAVVGLLKDTGIALFSLYLIEEGEAQEVIK